MVAGGWIEEERETRRGREMRLETFKATQEHDTAILGKGETWRGRGFPEASVQGLTGHLLRKEEDLSFSHVSGLCS